MWFCPYHFVVPDRCDKNRTTQNPSDQRHILEHWWNPSGPAVGWLSRYRGRCCLPSFVHFECGTGCGPLISENPESIPPKCRWLIYCNLSIWSIIMLFKFHFAFEDKHKRNGRMLTLGRYCPLSKVISMSVQVELSRACTRTPWTISCDGRVCPKAWTSTGALQFDKFFQIGYPAAARQVYAHDQRSTFPSVIPPIPPIRAVDLLTYKGGIQLEIPLEVDPSESEIEQRFIRTHGESVDARSISR